MTTQTISRLVLISSILFAACGLALVFEPVGFGGAIGLTGGNELPLSMWGAGLLGFGALNWTARTMILGGIYGRAVVMGNALHAFVGFLTLLRIYQDTNVGMNGVLAAVMLAYLFNAVLFMILQFNSPKRPADS